MKFTRYLEILNKSTQYRISWNPFSCSWVVKSGWPD